MVTIKKKHNIELNERFIKQYSSVVRYAYKRIINDKITSLSELEKLVKNNMLNINELDASWIKSAVKKATELNKEHKIYFGGKKNFFKRKYKKINELDKSIPFDMRGSCSDSNGNRKSELNIINGNEIIFKPKMGVKQSIKLNLSKNEYKQLCKLDLECKDHKNYFNIKLDKEYIYISFDESKIKQEPLKQIPNRILGIDLNPNWIAFTIQDFNDQRKTIHKEIISLKELNIESTNKKKHEIYEIVKRIIKQCIHYQVNIVVIEKLNICSKSYNKGKKYNKLLNNDWNRNDFVNNLHKWLNINNIKMIQINPAYSSFMGQIDNPNDYDSIAASLEIGYRGYLFTQGIKNYITDRTLDNNELQSTRWKKMIANQIFNSYIELYDFFKKMKFLSSYRFIFQNNGFSLRLNSIKSKIIFYNV